MFIADNWKDYEVIDTSKGEKLERWGKYILVRPDPQVIWDTPKKDHGWKNMNGHYHRSSKGGGEWEKFLSVALYLFKVLLVGIKMTSQVKIMKKGVAFITYIYEACVKSRHEFLNLCDVDVSHRERSLTRFVLVFHQLLILHESDRNVLLLDVNYNFACHTLQ